MQALAVGGVASQVLVVAIQEFSTMVEPRLAGLTIFDQVVLLTVPERLLVPDAQEQALACLEGCLSAIPLY